MRVRVRVRVRDRGMVRVRVRVKARVRVRVGARARARVRARVRGSPARKACERGKSLVRGTALERLVAPIHLGEGLLDERHPQLVRVGGVRARVRCRHRFD